jgi:hypothetical protein
MGCIHLASQTINERVNANKAKSDLQKVARDFDSETKIAETLQ